MFAPTPWQISQDSYYPSAEEEAERRLQTNSEQGGAADGEPASVAAGQRARLRTGESARAACLWQCAVPIR